MRILLYTLILSTLALNFNYCDCFPLNARTIEKLKEKSDLIAIGFPTEIIVSENNYEEDIVVFQIDSLIKGKNLNSRTILINQNQAGNCANYFELCEQYVITGEKIQNVKQTYRMGQNSHSKNLEDLVLENYMISTDGCRTFKLNSSLAETFLD